MAVSVFINDLPLKTTPIDNLDKLVIQGSNTEIVNLSAIREYARDGYNGSTLSTTVTAVSSTSPLVRYKMVFNSGLLTELIYI